MKGPVPCQSSKVSSLYLENSSTINGTYMLKKNSTSDIASPNKRDTPRLYPELQNKLNPTNTTFIYQLPPVFSDLVFL